MSYEDTDPCETSVDEIHLKYTFHIKGFLIELNRAELVALYHLIKQNMPAEPPPPTPYYEAGKNPLVPPYRVTSEGTGTDMRFPPPPPSKP